MVRTDFNSFVNFGQNTLVDTLKGLADVHRKNSVLTTDRLPAKTQVRRMCSPILWQLSDKNFLLLRSIPLYGFCSDNISPESSGHRDLSASDEAQVVLLRYSWKSFSQHSGKAIGVAVSDSSTGPFVDARGSALVTYATPPSPNAWDDIDPTDFDSFSSGDRKAFKGLALVIVRGKPGQPGTIKLKAESDALESTTVTLQSVAEKMNTGIAQHADSEKPKEKPGENQNPFLPNTKSKRTYNF
jgi:hypothetical protein